VYLSPVTYPLLVGYLDVDVHFQRSFNAGAAYTVISLATYTNEVVFKPPLFLAKTDW
jgi:hypothetical protein